MPLAPIGWPKATAPPCTFIFSWGMFNCFMAAIVTTEKASLTSNRSTLGDGKPELLHQVIDRADGGQGEPLRLAGVGRVAEDPGLRLHAEGLGLLGRDHDDGGGGVVDARRIAGRDAAGGVEGRPQGPQFLLVEAARLLVLADEDGSLAALDLHGDQFLGEELLFLRL